MNNIESSSFTPEVQKEHVELYELLNEQGEFVVTSQATTREIGLDHRDRMRYELTAWSLVTKEGKNINVFELIQPTKPVYITEGFEHYFYDAEKGYAEIPPLSSLKNIAVAMHELGHMKQYEEAFFQKLWKMEKDRMARKPLPSVSYWPEIKEKIGSIQENASVKEAFQLDQNIIDQLEGAYQAYEDFFDSIPEDEEETGGKVRELDRRQAEVERQFLDIIRNNETAIRNFLNYPQIILERNATKRALTWLRTLRDEYHVPIVQGNSGVKYLKESLETYYYKKA